MLEGHIRVLPSKDQPAATNLLTVDLTWNDAPVQHWLEDLIDRKMTASAKSIAGPSATTTRTLALLG